MATAAAAAAATVPADPPGYFVGRPLHYQEQQPQTAAAVAAPTVDDQNSVNSQVPGYYRGRVQQRPEDGPDQHNNNNNSAAAAVQQNQEQLSFFAKLFVCFSGSSGNAN